MLSNGRFASSQIVLRKGSPVRQNKRFSQPSKEGVNPDATFKHFVKKDIYAAIDEHAIKSSEELKTIRSTSIEHGKVPHGTTTCTYKMLNNEAKVDRESFRIS